MNTPPPSPKKTNKYWELQNQREKSKMTSDWKPPQNDFQKQIHTTEDEKLSCKQKTKYKHKRNQEVTDWQEIN